MRLCFIPLYLYFSEIWMGEQETAEKPAKERDRICCSCSLQNRDFVNGPATYALTGVEVGACQKPQLADFVPAAYWLSG